MSEVQIGAAIAVVTTLVLMIGIPIAFGLAGVAIVSILIFSGPDALVAVPRVFFEEVNGFAMLSLPMFILLGSIVGSSQTAADIHGSAHRWFGRIPGGLIIANIIACGLFSAICGSSPATAAAIGRSGIPEMRARGVSGRMAAGAICAGGTLGILIPPSITMILYGIATGTSIGKLFMAGVVPGILLICFFSVYAWWASRGTSPMPEPTSSESNWATTRRLLPFLSLIAMVLVVLYGGFATPSEAAAVAALIAVLLVFVLYRPKLREWQSVASEVVRDSSMLLMIVAAAGLFAYMLSLLYVTQTFGEILAESQLGPWGFFTALCVFLLIGGCFLPPPALILVVMPIVLPSLTTFNFDLIWFGVIMTILLEIGLITPPVGVNLFVIHGIAPDLTLREILEGSLPYVIIMLLSIVLFSLVPELVTWLPSHIMGG